MKPTSGNSPAVPAGTSALDSRYQAGFDTGDDGGLACLEQILNSPGLKPAELDRLLLQCVLDTPFVERAYRFDMDRSLVGKLDQLANLEWTFSGTTPRGSDMGLALETLGLDFSKLAHTNKEGAVVFCMAAIADARGTTSLCLLSYRACPFLEELPGYGTDYLPSVVVGRRTARVPDHIAAQIDICGPGQWTVLTRQGKDNDYCKALSELFIAKEKTTECLELYAVGQAALPTRATVIQRIMARVAARADPSYQEDSWILGGARVFRQLGEMLEDANRLGFPLDGVLGGQLNQLAAQLQVAENRAWTALELLRTTELYGIAETMSAQLASIGQLRHLLRGRKKGFVGDVARILRRELYRLEYDLCAGASAAMRSSDTKARIDWSLAAEETFMTEAAVKREEPAKAEGIGARRVGRGLVRRSRRPLA